VEFASKGQAKAIAAALNGQNMGGNRRSAHYYDLWCIKYLPKFKWDHLTEQMRWVAALVLCGRVSSFPIIDNHA
jgi:ESF2/ABP1 family protein